jgi:hypothetical protein
MLGADGKLAVDQRPPIDLIDVWPVDSQAAMLALAEATVGDFAVRADSGLVYVLQAAPPAVLANWLEISTPAPVSSVNGKVGSVVLSPGDVGAVPVARKVQTAGCSRAAARWAAISRSHCLRPPRPKRRRGSGQQGAHPGKPGHDPCSAGGQGQCGGHDLDQRLLTGGGQIGGNPRSASPLPARPRSWPAPKRARRSPRRAWPVCPGASRPMACGRSPAGLLMWVQVRQLINTERTLTVAYPDSFSSFVVPLSLTGWNSVFSISRDLWLQFVGEPGFQLHRPDAVRRWAGHAHRRLQRILPRGLTMSHIYYSAARGGFFHADNHATLPDDAVRISRLRHRQLLEAQAQGRQIVANEAGRPVLAPIAPPSLEQMRAPATAAVNREAARRIKAVATIERQTNDNAVIAQAALAAATGAAPPAGLRSPGPPRRDRRDPRRFQPRRRTDRADAGGQPHRL